MNTLKPNELTNHYKAHHLRLNANGKVEETTACHNKSQHAMLPYFGTPISPGVAVTFINNYVDSHWVDENTPLSFTFGRKGIEEILNQGTGDNKCQGIRFYLAVRNPGDFEVDDPTIPKSGLTLIAIGVNEELKNNGIPGDEPDHCFNNGKKKFLSQYDRKKEIEFRNKNKKNETLAEEPEVQYGAVSNNDIPDSVILDTVPTWPPHRS